MSVCLLIFFIKETSLQTVIKFSTDNLHQGCFSFYNFYFSHYKGGWYLKRSAYGILEVINGDKVREEWQDVLNLDEFTLLQELHCLLDVILLPHHMFRYTNTNTARHLLPLLALTRTKMLYSETQSITNGMLQCPTWKAYSCSTRQQIPCFYATWRFIALLTTAHH